MLFILFYLGGGGWIITYIIFKLLKDIIVPFFHGQNAAASRDTPSVSSVLICNEKQGLKLNKYFVYYGGGTHWMARQQRQITVTYMYSISI